MIVKSNLISVFPPKTPRSVVESSNGVNLENICTNWQTEEEGGATGNYVLDGTFIVDKEGLYKNIVEESILKVRIEGRFEYFVINKPKINTRTVTITALHITIREQKQLWIDDVRPTDDSGMGALQHLYNNAVGTKEITLSSDIPVFATAYYQLMNMYKALYDCDQSFINRWGGETKRRGYNVTIDQKRGSTSKLTIREGKNLTGFNVTTNTDTFCTRGIGKGFDGIKGDYVESPLINKYARVNTQVFEYNDVRLRNGDEKEEDGYMYFDTLEEAKAELNRRVELEFSENHIDEIQATYDISFEQLADTEEYKDYAYLETAEVGDIVKVYVPSLDIEVSVRVTKKIYNGSTQRTDNMTLSNTTTSTTLSMASIIADLKTQYIKTGNDNMNEYLTSIINAGMQDSNVIVRKNEILIMDTADINTAKSVWRFNNGALTHTNNGYYANDWNIGLTKDGIINADMVRTGILTAILIQSENGDCTINLESGIVNFKKGRIGNDTTYMDLNRGEIVTTKKQNNKKFGLSISNGGITSNGEIQINSIEDCGFHLYENLGDIISKASIEVAPTYNGERTAYSSIIRGDLIFLDGRDSSETFPIRMESNVDCFEDLNVRENLKVKGDFEVDGNKNCVQTTKNYQKVPFYSVEDINSLLTVTPIENTYKTELNKDTGNYCKIININTLNGYLPNNLMADCLNTSIGYNVYIDKQGFGDYYVKKYNGYFIVFSDRELEFKFKIEARRVGFEDSNINKHLKKMKESV